MLRSGREVKPKIHHPSPLYNKQDHLAAINHSKTENVNQAKAETQEQVIRKKKKKSSQKKEYFLQGGNDFQNVQKKSQLVFTLLLLSQISLPNTQRKEEKG